MKVKREQLQDWKFRLRVSTKDVLPLLESANVIRSTKGEITSVQFLKDGEITCLEEQNLTFIKMEGNSKGLWIFDGTSGLKRMATESFPEDGRWTLSFQSEAITLDHAGNSLERVLLYFMTGKDLYKSDLFNFDIILSSALRSVKEGKSTKYNAFLHALHLRADYDENIQRFRKEGQFLAEHFFDAPSDDACSEDGTYVHKLCSTDRSKMYQLEDEVSRLALEEGTKGKFEQIADIAKKLLSEERRLMPACIKSDPATAMRLINSLSVYEVSLGSKFDETLDRLRHTARDMDNFCEDRLIKVKFLCHYGDILVKASKFDDAFGELNKAHEILMQLPSEVNLRISLLLQMAKLELLRLKKDSVASHIRTVHQLIASQETSLKIALQEADLHMISV